MGDRIVDTECLIMNMSVQVVKELIDYSSIVFLLIILLAVAVAAAVASSSAVAYVCNEIRIFIH